MNSIYNNVVYAFSVCKEILITNIVVGVAQRTPTISYISQEQIKDIGETVELICSVQYAQDYPVLWIKLNKDNGHEQVALSTGTALIIRDSRFSLKHDTASSYTLQVRLSRYCCNFQYICICHLQHECEITFDISD